MGKLQAFDIIFDGDKAVYKPGESVTGQVRIVVNEEKGDIRGINVKCIGKAYTHWTESEGSKDNRRSVSYSWTVPFFKQEITLRGADKTQSNAGRIVLPQGDHRFPFQFQIPQRTLPPQFEGTVGWVRYYVKATIDRPWKFDHTSTKFFSIWTVKDLNHFPNVLRGETGYIEKTVCCLCCASGPISLRGSIDKRGYVPGERIIFCLELNNQSSRKICSIKVSLVQRATYLAKRRGHGRTHVRHSTKSMAEVKLDGCDAWGTVSLDRSPLLIQPVPPNSFEMTPNIDIEYYVLMEADVSGTPLDAEVKCPVTIGTVPAFAPNAMPPQPPPQQGVPPQQAGYPPQQAGYPPQQPGYPPQPGPTAPPGQPLGQPQPGPGYLPIPGQVEPGHPQPPGAGQPVPQQGYPPPGQDQGYPPPLPDQANGYQANQAGPSAFEPPPPTYEMAVGGPQEITGNDKSFGTVSYAPRYPYYNLESMYQSMGMTNTSNPGQPVVAQPQGQLMPYNPYQQDPAQNQENLPL